MDYADKYSLWVSLKCDPKRDFCASKLPEHCMADFGLCHHTESRHYTEVIPFAISIYLCFVTMFSLFQIRENSLDFILHTSCDHLVSSKIPESSQNVLTGIVFLCSEIDCSVSFCSGSSANSAEGGDNMNSGGSGECWQC